MATSKGYGIDLNQIRVQLRSSIPSEAKKSIDQVRKTLQENPNDADLYTLLVEAGRENVVLQDEIINLLLGMSEKGAVLASSALSALNKPVEVQKPVESMIEQPLSTQQVSVETDLMNLADDAYYAAEYDKAIAIYNHILEEYPNNQRARQQKEKAELNRTTASSGKNIPKEALKKFRQARSFIAARDFKAAIGLLTEAVELSHQARVEFSEANITLNRLQELLDAADYRDRGNEALRNGEWEIAQELFHKAHRLDTTDQAVNKAEEVIQMLRRAEAFFESYVMRVGSTQDQMDRLQSVADTIAAAERLNETIGVKRFNILQAKYELFNACIELNKHRMIGFASQGRLANSLRVAQDILPSEDSTRKYAEEVLKKAREERFQLSVIVVVVLGLLALIGYFAFIQESSDGDASMTVTITASNVFPLLTATHLPTPSYSPSITFTLSPTPSLTITSTAQADLVTAYITTIYGHYLDAPNGRWIGELTRNQAVTVLEKKLLKSGEVWYFCEWEKDDLQVQGWIFGGFLSFTPRNTATPTITLSQMGVGYINIGFMHPQDQPNGSWVAELRRNQIVTIYDSLIVNDDMWYFCRWDMDGEGWILSQYVVLGTPTTKP